MRIFLTGVGCVGKTTIGKILGEFLGVRFFDIDSRPIKKKQTPSEKKLYLREIKKDLTYFRTSDQRANLQVDISGLDAEQTACKVKDAVKELHGKVVQEAKSE